MLVDDWYNRRWVRNNFQLSLGTGVVRGFATHTGLGAGQQRHKVRRAIMSPWGSIAELLKMVPEADDVMRLGWSRGAAGGEGAWDISCQCMDLQRLA